LLLSDWRKAVVLVAATIVVGAVAAAFRPEYPIYVMSGFGGGLAMLRFSDTAQLLCGSDAVHMLRLRLERSRFRKSVAPERWTPPLPRYLRWEDAFVEIEKVDSAADARYRVSGPYSYLIRLSRGLAA
jgi:hypothetical protein